LIKSKQHLTEIGLHKLLSLKSALNLGLSETLKAAFPNIITRERPIYIEQSVLLNPYWVSGFIDPLIKQRLIRFFSTKKVLKQMSQNTSLVI
jgi:hypothetical protein